MKRSLFISFFAILLAMSCHEVPAKPDILHPVITLMGNKVDTAFLNTVYKDPTAEVSDELHGCLPVVVTGKVNTGVMGIYYLDYDYKDEKGNVAATVTRTIHVIKDRASFLYGPYQVVCTYSVFSIGSPTCSVTTNTYSAKVTPSSVDKHFELNQLNIGSEYLIPFASLNDNSIYLNFFRQGGIVSSGTLSPSKNTFTIETACQVPGNLNYACQNIYTKTELEKTENKIFN